MRGVRHDSVMALEPSGKRLDLGLESKTRGSGPFVRSAGATFRLGLQRLGPVGGCYADGEVMLLGLFRRAEDGGSSWS